MYSTKAFRLYPPLFLQSFMIINLDEIYFLISFNSFLLVLQNNISHFTLLEWNVKICFVKLIKTY